MAINLPGALAASDIPSYLAQVVRELNTETAAFADAAAKIENLMTSVEQMRGRLVQIESRLGPIEAQLKAMAPKGPGNA